MNRTEKYLALAALSMLTILSACRRSEVPGMENSPISLTAGVAGDTRPSPKQLSLPAPAFPSRKAPACIWC
ncbi:MAG: hypothetical protein IKI85_02580 [Bacteroidales bacterium]|nr:hypothetical protein [Bacteroidales bacterium]